MENMYMPATPHIHALQAKELLDVVPVRAALKCSTRVACPWMIDHQKGA